MSVGRPFPREGRQPVLVAAGLVGAPAAQVRPS